MGISRFSRPRSLALVKKVHVVQILEYGPYMYTVQNHYSNGLAAPPHTPAYLIEANHLPATQ
jgi:hypothetical protein